MNNGQIQPRPPKVHLDAREQARDLLAQSKPGRFVASMVGKLEESGEAMLARLFWIATDDSGQVRHDHQSAAIKMILTQVNSEKIMAVAMGLQRHVGRPGGDAEREAEEQAAEWAAIVETDVVEMEENPEGSGNYQPEEAPDDPQGTE